MTQRYRSYRRGLVLTGIVGLLATATGCFDSANGECGKDGRCSADPGLLHRWVNELPKGQSIWWLPSGDYGDYEIVQGGKLGPTDGVFKPRGVGPDELNGVILWERLGDRGDFYIVTYLRPRHPSKRWSANLASNWRHLARRMMPSGQTVDIYGRGTHIG